MNEPVKKSVMKRMFFNAFSMTILAIVLYKMSGVADEGSVIRDLQPIFPIGAAAGWLMAICTAIIEFRDRRKRKENSRGI